MTSIQEMKEHIIDVSVIIICHDHVGLSPHTMNSLMRSVSRASKRRSWAQPRRTPLGFFLGYWKLCIIKQRAF